MSPDYIETYTISSATARLAVERALEEGAARGLRVTAAVIDPTMRLVAFARADGTAADSEAVTRRKASTAAISGHSTGGIPDHIVPALTLASGNLLTNLRGGFPLVFDGRVVAGLGISCGEPDDEDAVFAAVRATLGADEV
jgi:glc operon protein GlcG